MFGGSRRTSRSRSRRRGTEAGERTRSSIRGHQPGAYPSAERKALFVLKRTVREFNDDISTDLAAALTYYSVLAIFPALIALLSLVGLFGQAEESVDTILEILAPADSPPPRSRGSRSRSTDLGRPGRRARARHRCARCPLVGVRLRRRLQPGDEPHLRGRGGPAVLADAADAADRHGRHGRALRRRPGDPDRLRSASPSRSARRSASATTWSTVWNIAKWPVLALVVMMIVALLYWATPNVQFTRFRIISVGCFVAILVWLVASVGFAFYVANFGSYNKTYGSIAGVVVGLLWLWITNVALLFGAELDAELERGRAAASRHRRRGDAPAARSATPAASRRPRHGGPRTSRCMRDIRLARRRTGRPGRPPFGRGDRPGRRVPPPAWRRLAAPGLARRARRARLGLPRVSAAGQWREQVAREKRAAYAGETYWGRPIPGWGSDRPGDPDRRPRSGGPRRQPHRPRVHG